MTPFRVSEGADRVDLHCHACKGRIPAGTPHPSAVLEGDCHTLFPICGSAQCLRRLLYLLTGARP